MLVISRKVGESVLMGPDLAVTILAVRDGKVRLGIKAPEGMAVLRPELRERMPNFDQVLAGPRRPDVVREMQ